MSMADNKRTLTDMVYDKLSEYSKIGTVEELRKAVKEEDVLKFYYIESEDKYVVGQRTDTRYYGEIGKTGITFYMSRYLPWGEHIVAPETAWKEHKYPSEPKEIPFFDWLQGFMKKEYGGTPEEFRELKEKATAIRTNAIDEFVERLCTVCCGESMGVILGNRVKADMLTVDGVCEIAYEIAEAMKGE